MLLLSLYLGLIDRVHALRSSSDDGVTAVEYALMVAAIAAVIIVVVFLLGKTVSGVFNNVNTSIANGG